MTAQALQDYLHAHIPISAAMGTRVMEAGTDGVIIQAPLEPNINHRATAFGGSVSAVAILAGWAMVHTLLRHAGSDARTVIQRSGVYFHLPVKEDFEARALPPTPAEWGRFVEAMERWSKGRLHIRVEVACRGQVVGIMDGEYVATGAA